MPIHLIGLAVVLTVGQVLTSLLAEAQPSGKVYRLGLLAPAAPSDPSDRMSGAALLLKHLSELGYIESQNLILERRFAERQPDRLTALARELVEARSDVIV